MTSVQPQTLIGDRYQVSATLVQGAGSVVLRGLDTVLKRPVIIKLVTMEHTAVYRAGLGLTARVGHPAFVGIFDSFQHAGQLVIVQEQIIGQTFAELTRAELSPLAVAKFGRQVTQALAHAHRLGIAHGDLTPAALYRDQWGAARINNLGLPPDSAYFATAGAIMNPQAPAWIAQEPAPVDDIRAVGVALYLLLLRMDTPPAAASLQDASSPPDASPLQACLERILNTQHPRRITTAEELLAELNTCIAALDTHKATTPPWERPAAPTFVPKLVAKPERAPDPPLVAPTLTPLVAEPEPAPPIDALPTRQERVVSLPLPRAMVVGPTPPRPTDEDATWMGDEGAQLRGAPKPGSPSYLRGSSQRKPSRRTFDLTLWLALGLALFLFWLVIGYLAPSWFGK